MPDPGLDQTLEIVGRVIAPLHPELAESGRIDHVIAVADMAGETVLLDYDTYSRTTGYGSWHLELPTAQWEGREPITAKPTRVGPLPAARPPLLLSRSEAFRVASWYGYVHPADRNDRDAALAARLTENAEAGL